MKKYVIKFRNEDGDAIILQGPVDELEFSDDYVRLGEIEVWIPIEYDVFSISIDNGGNEVK